MTGKPAPILITAFLLAACGGGSKAAPQADLSADATPDPTDLRQTDNPDQASVPDLPEGIPEELDEDVMVVCVGGETHCENNAIMECLDDGSGWQAVETCGADQYCHEAACNDYVCIPDEAWCEGLVSRLCDGEGLSFSESPCSDGEFCDGGECYPWLCPPATSFCDGVTAKVCDSEGSAIVNELDCSASGKVCVDGGCTELLCEPGADFCPDYETVGHCADDGLTFGTEDCPEQHACVDGACQPWICEPGGPLCDETVATKCDEIGSGPTAGGTDCEEQGLVCQEGECIDADVCGVTICPDLPGYLLTCNAKDHCEYTNSEAEGWKQWDLWIYVPPGEFPMGGPANEGGAMHERPIHTVTFSYGFFISKFEAVVEQYEACLAAEPDQCSPPFIDSEIGEFGWGLNSSANNRADHPQNGLDWQQSQSFCGWLAPGGRLPTEAEWEYAATGSTHLKFPWGDTPWPTCENDTAVFSEGPTFLDYGCYQGGTWPVGSKAEGASRCGALGMSGNVFEWVEDWFQPSYEGAPADGSAWLQPEGTKRVLRGGSFFTSELFLRSAQRSFGTPESSDAAKGVRCVRPVDSPL